MAAERLSLDTRLVHAGEIRPGIRGAVALPIFQSANYEFDPGAAQYHDLTYGRFSNSPNHAVLHDKLAALEGAEAALVTASGMAAIAGSLLAVLSAGDHILLQDCLYGGVHDFVTRDFAGLGLGYDFIDAGRPDTWASRLRSSTRALYVESISNPLMDIPDLGAVVAFARDHGLVSLVDNTFASPVNFRPPELGFDLSLHSGTKYLAGHSDLVCGAVIGRLSLVERARAKTIHLGGCLDPHGCFLLHRSLKTLGLRVRRQNENALALARFLERHPAVDRVRYPGLESHPDHDRARRLFDGFGGMLSIELAGGVEAADRLLAELRIPIVAGSLGSVESLVTLPARTSHSGMSAEDRLEMGVSDALVRVSVGVESVDDLLVDFERALAAIGRH